MSFVDSPPGYGTRTVIDNAFIAAGVERTVTVEVADLGTAATYIRTGLGIGFLSWSILDDIDDSGLATVRIADYDLEWRLYVTTSATRPTSAATRGPALVDRGSRRPLNAGVQTPPGTRCRRGPLR